MHLMKLKVCCLGAYFRCIRVIGFSQGSEYTDSNASKVLALGADFRCIRFISIGPVSASNESNESKVLAFGPILDSFTTMSCIRVIRFRGPGGAWGSLHLKSRGVDF